jgi:hypothetical protein
MRVRASQTDVVALEANIDTHVVDASHRSAVEAVEDRSFVELARSGPKLTIGLDEANP